MSAHEKWRLTAALYPLRTRASQSADTIGLNCPMGGYEAKIIAYNPIGTDATPSSSTAPRPSSVTTTGGSDSCWAWRRLEPAPAALVLTAAAATSNKPSHMRQLPRHMCGHHRPTAYAYSRTLRRSAREQHIRAPCNVWERTAPGLTAPRVTIRTRSYVPDVCRVVHSAQVGI